jgi:hypothetical protein
VLNKQHLPCLQAVRTMIGRGVHEFICHALYAYKEGPLTDDVRQVIEAGLEGHCAFSNWCGQQWEAAGIDHDEMPYAAMWYSPHTSDLPRLARLAWLDKLIWDIEHAQ